MRLLRRALKICILLLLMIPVVPSGVLRMAGLHDLFTGACLADRLPVEPEEDDSEYFLDLETNAYSRLWREMWDEGDNRMRFRLGSNNVREWFLEEELKFSSPLLNRLRVRYRHGRLHRYTSDRESFDIFEFEGRVQRDFFVSLFVHPTFSKPENSVGLMFQCRKAVNDYFIFFIEFPHFLRNFTEDHSDPPDSVRTRFDTSPVRIGVDVRELLYPHLWMRLRASTTNVFDIRSESYPSGERINNETGKVTDVSGYLEYVFDPELSLREQSAAGVESFYHKTEKARTPMPEFFIGQSVFAGQSPFVGQSPFERAGSVGDASAAASFFAEDENSPFTPTQGDSVGSWIADSRYMKPYAWIALDERFTLCAAVRIEKRDIKWLDEWSFETKLTNWYAIPSIGVRWGLGARKASIIDAGFVGQYRKRERLRRTCCEILSRVTGRYRDNRLYIAYEYYFNETKSIRVLETIDLDREDWGQFSIHDHGFFQMQFGF
jgi:hypothetical protein